MKPESVQNYLENGCGRCELGGTPRCKVNRWWRELQLLREIVLESELKEEVKWGVPCYTLAGKNIATLSALKGAVVLSFFRGAELSDPDELLELPGPNSRLARVIRFNQIGDIERRRKCLPVYLNASIALEKKGRRKAAASDALPDYPVELIAAFDADKSLKIAFEALTPGRQRGYLIYFGSAKQATTVVARINKLTAKIREGKGWNER